MIGDVLTSTILLEALRKKYPGAELHYLINSHTAPVVENNPFIDKLVLFTPKMQENKRVFYSFLKQIRKEEYDVVIDVYGKLSSILISFFSKAPLRISYHKKHTAFVYTDPISREKKPTYGAGLAIENRMKLLKPLGIEFENFSPKIFLTSQEIQEAKNFLKKSGISVELPLYMISVLGSGPGKTYPSNYMAEFLDHLVSMKPEAQLLFNYIPAQRETAKAIYDLCRPETQKQVFFEVYAGTLRKFMGIVHECDALLGNEGGAANMAKALGVSTFVIFCPYINKQNWFGELEAEKHRAVHLSDYMEMTGEDFRKAKNNPKAFYLKLTPDKIIPDLRYFLKSSNGLTEDED